MLILTLEEIALVGGSMSYCDSEDFSVGENICFSLGEINCLSKGFRTPALMKRRKIMVVSAWRVVLLLRQS